MHREHVAFPATVWKHRMLWVGRDLKDHLVSITLSWAGTPSTKQGCSKPHPAP